MLTGEFPDCEIKLCDLEISRVITAGTEVREMLGTPDYVGKYDRIKLTPLFIPPPPPALPGALSPSCESRCLPNNARVIKRLRSLFVISMPPCNDFLTLMLICVLQKGRGLWRAICTVISFNGCRLNRLFVVNFPGHFILARMA